MTKWSKLDERERAMRKSILVTGLLIFLVNGYASKPPVPLRSWRSESERIAERRRLENLKQKLDNFQMIRQKPLNNCMKSLVLPGLGQRSVKQNTKGRIFTRAIVLSAAGAGGLYLYSDYIYKKYKTADNIDDIERYYDESNRFYLWSQYALGASLGVWALNVVDAYFSTKSFNNKLFQGLLGFNVQTSIEFTLCFTYEPGISMGITQRF
jgi:hypothetical protein